MFRGVCVLGGGGGRGYRESNLNRSIKILWFNVVSAKQTLKSVSTYLKEVANCHGTSSSHQLSAHYV